MVAACDAVRLSVKLGSRRKSQRIRALLQIIMQVVDPAHVDRQREKPMIAGSVTLTRISAIPL